MCIKREKKQHLIYVNGYKTKRYTTQNIYQYQSVSD